MTLEHAPPESVKGSVVCLTCGQCNNRASRVDQHAILAKRAVDEWSSGQGARVEVDFLGVKMSSRFVPRGANSPLPTRVSHLGKGSIELGALRPRPDLDARKGVRFRIPRSPHYEAVGMIKSAYLMVFSLMGEGGYGFADSVALGPVREEIQNPAKKILKGGFVVSGTLPETAETKKHMVFLCHAARPALWIIPMWDRKVVLLPCGGPEPIDEFVATEDQLNIANHQLTGWTASRFDESVGVSGAVSRNSGIVDGTLVGTTGLLPTDKGEWEWIVVNHDRGRYVALPFRPANETLRSDSLNVVAMLGGDAVQGRGLDPSSLVRLNLGDWSKNLTIDGVTDETSSQAKGDLGDPRVRAL